MKPQYSLQGLCEASVQTTATVQSLSTVHSDSAKPRYRPWRLCKASVQTTVTVQSLGIDHGDCATISKLLPPFGVTGHVPGDVVDAVLRRQELVEVNDSRVQLLTQDLFMLSLLPLLGTKPPGRHSKTTCLCPKAPPSRWPSTQTTQETLTENALKTHKTFVFVSFSDISIHHRDRLIPTGVAGGPRAYPRNNWCRQEATPCGHQHTAVPIYHLVIGCGCDILRWDVI